MGCFRLTKKRANCAVCCACFDAVRLDFLSLGTLGVLASGAACQRNFLISNIITSQQYIYSAAFLYHSSVWFHPTMRNIGEGIWHLIDACGGSWLHSSIQSSNCYACTELGKHSRACVWLHMFQEQFR